MTNTKIFILVILAIFAITACCDDDMFVMTDPTDECVNDSTVNGYLIYFKDYDPEKGLDGDDFFGSITIDALEAEGDNVVAWCPCGVAWLSNNTPLSLLERKESAISRLEQNGEDAKVSSNYKLDQPNDLDVITNLLKLDRIDSSSIVANVGWIDGAIDFHDDRLKDNLYINPYPNSDKNCIDNDLNGYNFATNSNDVAIPLGIVSHGTQTFGVYDIATNNSSFHTFVAPLIVDNLYSLTCALSYAAMMDFDAVNASVGFSVDANDNEENQELEQYFTDLLKPLKAKNILLVCSAGNCGISTDTDRKHYPSGLTAFDLPVISVAATDSTNTALVNFSNYGVNTVDVAARGENVETYVENGVEYVSGTSFAAPLVTAKVVEIRIAHPAWSWQQIKDSIIEESIKNHNLSEIKGGVLSPEIY